jgi:hypothetical protein
MKISALMTIVLLSATMSLRSRKRINEYEARGAVWMREMSR